MVTSSICKFEDSSTEWYRRWLGEIQQGGIDRKLWEWCIISQALWERGVLRPGARGLGFAVGQEPLASLYARYGASIDATDIAAGEVADLWSAASAQHAASLEAVYKPGIIDRPSFEERVKFFPADMNDVSGFPTGEYDFMWSSCAMEHLGSLEHGLTFVRNSMRLLKVGGVACHTTEINVSDLDDTIFDGTSVIYREQDIRRLSGQLRRQYCVLEEFDFRRGDAPQDVVFDSYPWGSQGQMHLKLMFDGFVCTSALLICRRYA
jgi:hypothetical protein